MRKVTIFLLVLGMIGFCLMLVISKNLQTERNDVTIKTANQKGPATILNIAVVGDVHLSEGSESMNRFRDLLFDIRGSSPDLVVFVGDYIGDPAGDQLDVHRRNIIKAMKVIDPIPRAVVMGNYETWSNAEEWLLAFKDLGVKALENEVAVIQTAKGPVCVRGLGDRYTGRFSYVDYQRECEELPKVTITHDPAGAFDSRVRGLVISGHTHCGQVSFPVVGPLWVPSNAQQSAHCGLYQDPFRTVFVTSGVGTAVLPVRFGTQSEWDFLDVHY